jgi:hypothetical protein
LAGSPGIFFKGAQRSTVQVVLNSAGGLDVSETLIEWRPASLEMSNFFPSTRMCSQSIDTAAARCPSRKGREKRHAAADFMISRVEEDRYLQEVGGGKDG